MRIYSFFLGLAFLLALSLPATSQTITGFLEGKVSDKSGAVVPGAKVDAVNTETGFSRSTVTNCLGDYRIVQLPVG